MNKKALFRAAAFFAAVTAFGADIVLPHITTVVSGAGNPGETVIGADELERFSTAQEALESAGFSFKGTNNELTFHGYWNSSIKVYINGVLMNDPNTGKFDFATLDISTVTSIRIDPAATDGAVAVYIRTVAADYTKCTARAAVSAQSYIGSPFDGPAASAGFSLPVLFDSGSAFFVQDDAGVSYKKNRFGYRSSDAAYKPTLKDSYSGYGETYEGYGQFLVNNALHLNYSDARFPGASFGLSNYVSYSDSGCGKEGGFYFSEKNQKTFLSSLSLPVFIPFTDGSVRILPSYTYSGLDYTHDARYSSLENEYNVHNLAVRLESSFLRFFSLSGAAAYDISSECARTDGRTEHFSHSLFTASVSPEVRLGIGGFDVSLALPLNFFESSKSESADVLYRLALSRSVSDFRFFAQSSRNVTNPVFQQLYYSGDGGNGNPDLQPESALSFSAGAEYSGAFSVEIKPFLIFYRDKIGWASSGGIWSPENCGSSVNWGTDISFSTGTLLRRFEFQVNYEFCRAMLTQTEFYGNQIMMTPAHKLNAVLKIPVTKNFLWRSDFSFTSKRFLDNKNSRTMSETYILNTEFSLTLKKFKFRLKWNNILDLQYCQADGYPSPGTSFEAKINFSF